MRLQQWIATALVGSTVAGCLAIYVGLIVDGTVPPPDFDALARAIGVGTFTVASIFAITGLAVIGTLALVAPIIYAVRAHDLLTVLISVALTGSAVVLLVISRSILVEIGALILYLANVTLSSAVYVAHKIAPPAL